MARAAFPRSGDRIMIMSASGTICQDTPYLSFSHPHTTGWPPSAVKAAHSRSTSAWSLQLADSEMASVKGLDLPPFSACYWCPAIVNSTNSTSPFLPPG